MNTDLKYILLHSDLMNEEESVTILKKYENILAKVGCYRENFANISEDENLLYFILTGGTENVFLQMHEKRKKLFPEEPVHLIAHSGNNSLPASLEILAKLKQEGQKGKIIYLSGNEQNDLEALRSSAKNLRVYKKLRKTKIGLIGKPSDWLIASSPDIKVAEDTWGVNVEEFDFQTLLSTYNEVSDSKATERIKQFRNDAGAIVEPTENDLMNSAKVYEAIKMISEKNELQSVSVRCFDILTSDNTTGCFALSQLTDEGVIAGCEGDLVSTIAMLWAHLMSDKSPWMANPARIDLRENRLILAHCTVPRKIVSQYDIRSHFESGKGVGLQGKIEEGPVTLIRLGGKGLKMLWLAEGEIIANGNDENMCRTQVEIRLHDRNKLKDLLNNPLGNHIVLVHGFHADVLEEWHNEFIL